MLVSSVHQSGSGVHVRASVLSQMLFPFRLLQTPEQNSLCDTVSPSWSPLLSLLSLQTHNPSQNTGQQAAKRALL